MLHLQNSDSRVGPLRAHVSLGIRALPFVWTTCAVLMLAGSAIGQVIQSAELIVREGETYTITAENAVIHVDRWIMEDSSVLQLAEDVARVEIRALEATIGENVTINARGSDGVAGNSGGTLGHGPGVCNRGAQGGGGERGTPGMEGKTLDIRMGLVNANSLFIDATGGRGGNGGQGGRGQNGGRGSCRVILPDFDGCDGGKGGTGGNGGAAGPGGNGGTVSIEYWPITDPVSVTIIPNLEGGDPRSTWIGGSCRPWGGKF